MNFFSTTAAAAAALVVIAAGAALPASAQSSAPQTSAFSVFNTGVGANGAVLPSGTLGDPHYTLKSVPAGASSQIQVLTSAYGFPIVPNGWLGDSSTSAWIAPNNVPFLANNGPVGYYDYQTTFDLSGLDPATASLSGQWATDNFGTDILLNGVSTGSAVSNFNNAYTPFSITSGFQSGVNTLDFVVLDDGQGSTGLRVDSLAGSAIPAVPEASTTVSFGLLLALGLGAAVIARRKTVQA